MARLCSSIKVTLGGVELIDWTHDMEFEPRLPEHVRNVQVVPALRATYQRNIGRANIRNQIQFSRVENYATHELAQYWAFALPQSWPTTNGDCSIEIRGNADPAATLYELTLKDAVILSAPGEARASLTFHTVTIMGGQMEIVTAPS